MATVSLAEAEAQLGMPVDRVIANETVTITRQGREVVRSSAVSGPPQPVDPDASRAVTARIPLQPEGAAEFVRAMRDDERS